MVVGVPNFEGYWRSSCFSFENTGQEFYFVGFGARCGYVALSGTSSVELPLDVINVDRYTRGHTVNYTSYGSAVAFAERSESEYISKCVHWSIWLVDGSVAISATLAPT